LEFIVITPGAGFRACPRFVFRDVSRSGSRFQKIFGRRGQSARMGKLQGGVPPPRCAYQDYLFVFMAGGPSQFGARPGFKPLTRSRRSTFLFFRQEMTQGRDGKALQGEQLKSDCGALPKTAQPPYPKGVWRDTSTGQLGTAISESNILNQCCWFQHSDQTLFAQNTDKTNMKFEIKLGGIVLGALLLAGAAGAQPKLMWYNSCNNDTEFLKDGGSMSGGSASYTPAYNLDGYAGDGTAYALWDNVAVSNIFNPSVGAAWDNAAGSTIDLYMRGDHWSSHSGDSGLFAITKRLGGGFDGFFIIRTGITQPTKQSPFNRRTNWLIMSPIG
jgi:hypothetical protein